MSRWTHINGSLVLTGSVYETKVNEKTKKVTKYIPFPQKQIKVHSPYITLDKDGNKQTRWSATEYSLPRCKPIIEEAIKLLPQTETGYIHYVLGQDKNNVDLSIMNSNYFSLSEEKEFERQINMFYNIDTYNKKSSYYRLLKRTNRLKIWAIERCTRFTLSLSDDIRYCSGYKLLDCLEKFFDKLASHNINLFQGYLEWDDEYESDFIFAIRQKQYGALKYMLLDRKDNHIIAYKQITNKWNNKEKTFDKVVTMSDNWNELINKEKEELNYDYSNSKKIQKR